MSNKVLTIQDINDINENLNNYQQQNGISNIEEIPEGVMLVLLNPLVENGKLLHGAFINSLNANGSLYFESLTQEEQNSFLHPSDLDLAKFSLYTSVLYSNYTCCKSLIKLVNSPVGKCISAALGLGSIYALVKNAASLASFEVAAGAAMTQAEAIALLKLVGTRYLGWIGLGYSIVSFIDCYNDI